MDALQFLSCFNTISHFCVWEKFCTLLKSQQNTFKLLLLFSIWKFISFDISLSLFYVSTLFFSDAHNPAIWECYYMYKERWPTWKSLQEDLLCIETPGIAAYWTVLNQTMGCKTLYTFSKHLTKSCTKSDLL